MCFFYSTLLGEQLSKQNLVRHPNMCLKPKVLTIIFGGDSLSLPSIFSRLSALSFFRVSSYSNIVTLFVFPVLVRVSNVANNSQLLQLPKDYSATMRRTDEGLCNWSNWDITNASYLSQTPAGDRRIAQKIGKKNLSFASG